MRERRGRVVKEHIYKGLLDKPKRGRVEGGRWGSVGQGRAVWGNGDNCT